MAVKDFSFLVDTPYFNGGIYDNQQVYENTSIAIKNLVRAKFGFKTNLRMTEDHTIICYKDEDLMRLLHVEDKIGKCTYENISYISKFPVLTLNDLVDGKYNIPIIFELDKNKLDYKTRIVNALATYEGKYAIISNDIKTIRWLDKNYPDIIIGYKVDKSNIHKLHLFKKYDFICIDVNLYDDKQVRKLRESYIVIGHGIKDDNTFEAKKEVYDNLICDTQLEKN